ncbi:MAG TPA: outer membrane protein assembly factor BamD [bacterium]|nr:outer membrane protein assembly factor BamD [bacterium]
MKFGLYAAFFALLSVFIVSNLLAQATGEEAYAEAKRCYESVKLNPETSSVKAEYERCIDRFEKMSEAFPSDKRAADALYSAAKFRQELYFKFKDKSDLEHSIELYNKLVRQYPNSSLADDSLYQIAKIRHKPLAENEKAIKALEFQLEQYPTGDMAPKAKELLSSIKEAPPAASKPSALSGGRGEVAASVTAAQAAERNSANHFPSDVAGPFDLAQLLSYEVEDVGDSTKIELFFDMPVPYSVSYIEQGKRTGSPAELELALSYAKPSADIEKNLTVSSKYIDRIKLKKRVLGSGCVVSFRLKLGAAYDIVPRGKNLIVTFHADSGPSVGVPEPDPSDGPEASFSKSKKKSFT